ncbi:hypothetical protein RF11_16490 [Thelohanellus kitauei]|uniref:Uncharacterized protein n=1 Tax=Thelohanellus kitauei TaxID=669202 RepID=A0A0C2N9X8_THEKT|nr:hypothetical protein RF11_16490 [Thelohanellus kitauei]
MYGISTLLAITSTTLALLTIGFRRLKLFSGCTLAATGTNGFLLQPGHRWSSLGLFDKLEPSNNQAIFWSMPVVFALLASLVLWQYYQSWKYYDSYGEIAEEENQT